MRTVSFSSPNVRNLLNQYFVCAVLNTTGDPTAGSSTGHAPSDSPGICTRGIGKQNVQCLFMTPEGNLFHTASGFRNAEDLAEELRFALSVFRKVQETPTSAPDIVRQQHLARMRRQGFSDAEIEQPLSPFSSVTQMMRSMAQGPGFGAASQGPMNVGNIFAAKTRASDLADGLFGVHYPMMTMSDFLRDPRVLVGHEASSFSSVGNGGHSGNRIGN